MKRKFKVSYSVDDYEVIKGEKPATGIIDSFDDYIIAEDEEEALAIAMDALKADVIEYGLALKADVIEYGLALKADVIEYGLAYENTSDYSFTDEEDCFYLVNEITGEKKRYNFSKEWVKEI